VPRQIHGRPADNATVRIGGSLAVPMVLQDLGMDPAEVLGEAGFNLALFDDPDNLVAYRARGHLLQHCSRRTGCPHFGLLVGQRGGLHSLGLTGLLAKNSPDVETALRDLTVYFHLHVRGAATRLAVGERTAMMAYSAYEPGVEGSEQTGDGACAVMFNILRSLCGNSFQPEEVRFAHRRPADLGPYRRFFQAPLAFDAEEYAVVFARKWLARRLPTPDAELQRLLRKQVEVLEAAHGNRFPDQVRGVLSAALPTGHASAVQVAGLFSMHVRTFSRRLQESGASFRTLVDEQRFELARRMLRDTGLEVSRIAAALGYTDASAFGRAFRRWSGNTPARWRAQQASANMQQA
jgi:AraC-like DNA-binding protein